MRRFWFLIACYVGIGMLCIGFGIFLGVTDGWGAQWLSDEELDSIVVGAWIPATGLGIGATPLSDKALSEISGRGALRYLWPFQAIPDTIHVFRGYFTIPTKEESNVMNGTNNGIQFRGIPNMGSPPTTLPQSPP